MKKDVLVAEQIVLGILTAVYASARHFGQGSMATFLLANLALVVVAILASVIELGANKAEVARRFCLVLAVVMIAGAGLGFAELSLVAAFSTLVGAYVIFYDRVGEAYAKGFVANMSHLNLLASVFVLFRFGDRITEFVGRHHGLVGACRHVAENMFASRTGF